MSGVLATSVVVKKNVLEGLHKCQNNLEICVVSKIPRRQYRAPSIATQMHKIGGLGGHGSQVNALPHAAPDLSEGNVN